MVILPLYQIIYAALPAQSAKTEYFALMKHGNIRAIDIVLNFPSYDSSKQQICGVLSENEKDYIAVSALKMTETSPELLFTLSDHKILYPAVCGDNQKIIFLEQDEKQKTTGTLRAVLKEEFGWFPTQLKVNAALSPICWGGDSSVIYTDIDGNLMMTGIGKNQRSAKIADNAKIPDYHAATKRLAFVQETKIVLKGDISFDFEAGTVSAVRFSNDGNSLFFAVTDGNHFVIKRITLETRETADICDSQNPVVMISEI